MDGLLKDLEILTKERVLVGIPASSEPRKEGGPLSNAEIAYIQNFGSPEKNIPAREFMYSGIKNAQEKIAKALRLAGQASLKGEDPDRYLSQAGLIAQRAIRAKIVDGPFDPLAKSTVEARVRRGKKSDKPLIDTGQMKNAITYVLRKD